MFRERDAEFDGLLETHMSGKAEEQLVELDNRMSAAFEHESNSETDYERSQARRGIFGRTPAFRLALSHAVIALFFFGIGFYWQFAEQPSTDPALLRTTQSDQSEEMANETMQSNTNETEMWDTNSTLPNQQLNQARVLHYSMPRQVDNEQIGDLFGELDGFNIPSALGAQEESGFAAKSESADESEPVASSDTTASAASATTTAAEPESASDTDVLNEDLVLGQIMTLFKQMAAQQDGYLIALTNDSLVRVNINNVEVLLSDLQNPAGWSFGEEGEIIVFDRDGQEPVFWKLNRIDIPEERDN